MPFWGFSGFPSKIVKTNQRRKQDKTRSTQKKMQEPEVPAFYFICLGVPPPPGNRRGSMARWRVPDVIFFCTCPLYFTWVFLSYLMPSHFIGIFSLGPSILFYFFRVPPPPGNRRGSEIPFSNRKYLHYFPEVAITSPKKGKSRFQIEDIGIIFQKPKKTRKSRFQMRFPSQAQKKHGNSVFK